MAKLMTQNPGTDIDRFMPLGIDPVVRRFFGLMDPEMREGSPWLPSLNVYETKTELIVQLDIPGIDPKSVEINLQGQSLTVSGERKNAILDGDVRMIRCEHVDGSFQRTLQLPMHVDADEVSAKAEFGVMTITMPKAKQYVGRQIPVECK